MYYYNELNISGSAELKEFYTLISNPPQPIKSVYSELYASGDPIRQGMYVFRRKYGATESGLLGEILRIYQEVKGLPANVRFWMSSFVESLLRGTYHVLQLFVARSGVLQFIIRVRVLESLRIL